MPDERKIVTVLFADVVGSTVMGSQRDPELVRDVLRRFFARMKGIAESHGGTLEVTSAPERGATFTLDLPVQN